MPRFFTFFLFLFSTVAVYGEQPLPTNAALYLQTSDQPESQGLSDQLCTLYGDMLKVGRGPRGVGVANDVKCLSSEKRSKGEMIPWELVVTTIGGRVQFELYFNGSGTRSLVADLDLVNGEDLRRALTNPHMAARIIFTLFYDAPVSMWLESFPFFKSYKFITQPSYGQSYDWQDFPNGDTWEIVTLDSLWNVRERHGLLSLDASKTKLNYGQNVWRLNEEAQKYLNQNRKNWARRSTVIGTKLEDLKLALKQVFKDWKPGMFREISIPPKSEGEFPGEETSVGAKSQESLLDKVLALSSSSVDITYGFSIVETPELFSSARQLAVTAEIRNLDPWNFRFFVDTIPKIKKGEEVFRWERYNLGYAFDWDLSQWPIFFTRFEVVPQLGLWLLDGRFQVNAADPTSIETFRVDKEYSLASQFSIDAAKSWGLLRLWTALGTAKVGETSKGVTAPKKLSTRAFHLINGISFTRPMFSFGDNLDATYILFARNESLNLGNSQDSTISNISLSISFVGLGIGLQW